MNLVIWLEKILVNFGAGWVMWLMILLSVISLAIILERAWFFRSLSDDLETLTRNLKQSLEDSVDSAMQKMKRSPSAEAAVVVAGLDVYNRGPKSVEAAMEGAAAIQKMKLEKWLTYLATLGNNAPFIGLFGTVIGVIGAFKALGDQAKAPMAEAAQAALAPQAVMGAISEALVATAVGIAIAIPAVAANNYFRRSIKRTLANTEALSQTLLSHMLTDPDFQAGEIEEAVRSKAASGSSDSGNKKRGKSKSRKDDD